MTQVGGTCSTKTFPFGGYIMGMYQHMREEHESVQEKERERELFEVVDDYVEQA